MVFDVENPCFPENSITRYSIIVQYDNNSIVHIISYMYYNNNNICDVALKKRDWCY